MALFVFRDRPNTLLRVHKEICQRTPSMFLLSTHSSEVSDSVLPFVPVNEISMKLRFNPILSFEFMLHPTLTSSLLHIFAALNKNSVKANAEIYGGY